MTNEIFEAKENYYFKMSEKLKGSHTAPKAYCAILYRLIYNKKIPVTPPLLVDGNFLQTFNNYFASTCTPIKTTSVQPPFSYKINTGINYFKVTESDILSIIKSLDSTKADCYENLSIRMVKMCSESIILPLKIIFVESLKRKNFQKFGKKTNVVSVCKKGGNTFIVNYGPIVLLPIFGKISERLIYYSLFIISFLHLLSQVFFQKILTLPNCYKYYMK